MKHILEMINNKLLEDIDITDNSEIGYSRKLLRGNVINFLTLALDPESEQYKYLFANCTNNFSHYFYGEKMLFYVPVYSNFYIQVEFEKLHTDYFNLLCAGRDINFILINKIKQVNRLVTIDNINDYRTIINELDIETITNLINNSYELTIDERMDLTNSIYKLFFRIDPHKKELNYLISNCNKRIQLYSDISHIEFFKENPYTIEIITHLIDNLYIETEIYSNDISKLKMIVEKPIRISELYEVASLYLESYRICNTIIKEDLDYFWNYNIIKGFKS